MKIAIVNQPFGNINLPWTGEGGSIDIWIYEVARRLAQHCDVIVYTKRGRNREEVEYDQEVQYRRISTNVDEKFVRILSAADKRLLRFRNFKHPFFASSLYYFMYALQVAKNLKSQNCDVVHIINFSQFVPIIRAYNPRIKIVLHMTCEWLTQLDRAMIENRLNEVDLVTGCSQHIIGKIRRFFPQFAKQCETVYEGVDIDQFRKNSDNANKREKGIKNLLFVGRVSPEKGLHILLDAFHKVVKQFPQARLIIVGSKYQLPLEWLVTLSEDYKVYNLSSFYRRCFKTRKQGLSYFLYLQKLLFSLNISNHVTFTDFVPYKQVINYYKNADVLVNPSFSEAFGRSLIEAMACEVPVVATRVGGMLEIVEDGKTGILVEPGDASALAEAIIRLLSEENLSKSMGKAARERVIKLFSWEKIVEKLLHNYKDICEGDG
ncbi:MAG: glycosyltransferase family 4 protein [Candidatus Bathyarchaeia archaeon]